MREQVEAKLEDIVDRVDKILIQLSDDERVEFLDQLFKRVA